MISKHQVHNLIILDESGSMQSIKQPTIQGFNELVQTIQGIEKEYPEQEHLISFITFNSLKQNLLYFRAPVKDLELIDEKRYQPNSGTPLYDAMGFAINKLKQSLSEQKDYNVLVTILTDGEENASKEYSHSAIKSLIEELKQHGWTFTYIGTDHDVTRFAVDISINNSFAFNKSEAGISQWLASETKSRKDFSEKIRHHQNVNSDFY